jgi:hypothetical protein
VQPGGGCSGTSRLTGQQTSRCLTLGLTGNRSSANPTHNRSIKGCWQQGSATNASNINTFWSLTHARVVITGSSRSAGGSRKFVSKTRVSGDRAGSADV